ncbi:uncharacterized protein V1510DRAFT_411898 [Dipodascopsis tothii]|uniref:uncharacterized protein n=1 Tax=Dipodascopsis tothii TaxID=44089 RepID=UPI0034CE6766
MSRRKKAKTRPAGGLPAPVAGVALGVAAGRAGADRVSRPRQILHAAADAAGPAAGRQAVAGSHLGAANGLKVRARDDRARGLLGDGQCSEAALGARARRRRQRRPAVQVREVAGAQRLSGRRHGGDRARGSARAAVGRASRAMCAANTPGARRTYRRRGREWGRQDLTERWDKKKLWSVGVYISLLLDRRHRGGFRRLCVRLSRTSCRRPRCVGNSKCRSSGVEIIPEINQETREGDEGGV